jgi:hypothetical protein
MNMLRKESSISSKLIPFPNNSGTTASINSDSTVMTLLMNPEMESYFKNIVESAVFEGWMKNTLFDLKNVDDPFDPIYFSALTPDKLIPQDLLSISNYVNITDNSEYLIFDDDWEE